MAPSTKYVRLLLALLPAATVGGVAAWGFSAPPAPRFAVVPSSHIREGQGQVASLEAGASAEGFLDRLLGTNCFTAAVGELNADCRRMEQDAKTRLALRLTNCQLATQGSTTFPCNRRQSLKECTDALPDRAYSLFVEFLTHADSMCLFIQNRNFEKYTENMLNRLSEGATFARRQLAAAAKSSAALSKETSELTKKAEATLGMLRQHGEMEEEALKLQKKARAEALAYYMSLDAKQQEGLELQDQALLRQAALEAGQSAVLRQLADAQSHVAGLFDLVDGRAAELAAEAARQAEAQRSLAGELGALADSSAGVRRAVDVVIGYQQRSDSVLMRLLGKSYTLEDAAFYALGALIAMAAGVFPTFAKAKLPVLALLGISLLGERQLIDWLHMWMDVGDSGEVVLSLPAWSLFPLGTRSAAAAASAGAGQALWQFSLKRAVRQLTVALGSAVLLYSWLSYRDYEREGYLLLRQMEEEQRRRHSQYIALIKRQRLELAALLGGGSGSNGPAAPGAQDGACGVQRRRPGQQAVGDHHSSGKGDPRLPEAPTARAAVAGQLALRHGPGQLPAVPEYGSSEEEEGAESGDEEQHSRSHLVGAAPAAVVAPTPAARERGRRAVAAPTAPPARQSSAPHQKPAAAPMARKRGVTDAEAEAAAPSHSGGPAAMRRAAGGRRRSSASEEVAAGGSIEVDGNGGGGRLGLSNVVCEVADAERLSQYGDATFDAVTCCMGIMFVPDAEAAIAEFSRVLKPGGKLVVSVFHGEDKQPFYPFASQLASALPADSSAEIFPEAVEATAPSTPYHACRFGDPQPLLDWAAAAGLSGVECRELSLAYYLSAQDWWPSLAGLPDMPIKRALERAEAAAGTGGDVRGEARQMAERRLRERGWMREDGSVFCPNNMAWLITARKGGGA